MTIKWFNQTPAPQSASNPETDIGLDSRPRLWMAAIKPPMYSVAIIPIWVGTAVAWADRQSLNSVRFITFLLAAIAIIAWLNLSNDVFDSETGIDRNKPHSLVNLTHNKSLIFWIANGFLVLAAAGIVAIAWWQRDMTVLVLVMICCALGYSYQGPPFRLGYQGLGEPICFVTFGPLAVSAAYYSQSQTWSLTALAASLLVGISTSLILFCSHFHQVDDDLAAGKRSPVVRLGTALSADLLPWICASMFALSVGFVLCNVFPAWGLIIFASAPIAARLIRFVKMHHTHPHQVKTCKFIAVSFHFWSGVLLGASFLL